MKRIFVSLVVLLSLATSVWPQSDLSSIPLLGSKAPSFTAQSTEGAITFPDDFGNSWKILFSHPRDFTPVCTSEVLQLARMQDEFGALNVKIAVISSDEISQHELWKKSIEEIKQDGKNSVKIKFPIIDDSRIEASKLYGMIHDQSADVRYSRGVFIINPDNIIQAVLFYPMKVGRNMEEIKRTVEALQTVNPHVSTPANWQPGDDVLLPASPYLNPGLKDEPQLRDQYYNVGPVMWYKKVKN